jgi:hypothetical protein
LITLVLIPVLYALVEGRLKPGARRLLGNEETSEDASVEEAAIARGAAESGDREDIRSGA